MVLEKAEVEKPLKKQRVKRASSRGKPIEKKEAEVQSLAPDYMLLPYGQLLRGVPVQVKGEYKLPLTTNVYSFATRKRTKE